MSKPLTRNHFEALCETRNHILLSFDYTDIKSVLDFKCLICDHIWSSSAASYKNSKTGCWGCKKKAISDFTRARVFTPEGRAELSRKRKLRPAWNRGMPGSVPGNPTASRKPRLEHRHLSAVLYLIRYLDEDGTHFKLGITRCSLNRRFRHDQLISIIHLHHATLGECFDLEQSLLKWAKGNGHRYSSPTTTELIHPDGLPYLLDRLTPLCLS